MGPLSLSIVPFEAPVVNRKLRFNDSNTTELLLRSTLALFVRLNPFCGDLPVKNINVDVKRKKVELIIVEQSVVKDVQIYIYWVKK